MSATTFRVLLVEDDPGDVELTREALKESKLLVDLQVVDDGVKALAFLRREGEYQAAVQPDMVLLDLNLPKKDGREVLREIKSDERLRRLPVCILTTSSADLDVVKSYDLGCNCYITKPVGLAQFSEVVRHIEQFWLTIVTLPSRTGG